MNPPGAGVLAAPDQRASSPGLDDAAHRIADWLLDSGAQLTQGPHRGGVAGWLDGDGRPDFVYLEITGYYLTALAWLAGGASGPDSRAGDALAHGREALAWMEDVTRGGAVPATRIHLVPGEEDWRNSAVFTFDLAMAARGVAAFAAADPTAATGPLAGDLAERLREACGAGVPLASHRPSGLLAPPLPDKWSTRPGPHHLKAAAAMAGLPDDVLGPELAAARLGTIEHWAAALASRWPCEELHPLLYGLEGLVIAAQDGREHLLDAAEAAFSRLLRLQAPDGSIPAVTGPRPGGVRSDVLAQALRIGAILRAGGRLADDSWEPRLDELAGALLAFVRPDGGVRFSDDHPVANTWCAMFAHQALSLHAAPGDRALAERAALLLV